MEAPLNAVLDGKAMVEYDRLFHHLWRLKRVESALSQGWMRVTSNSRLFESIQGESMFCRLKYDASADSPSTTAALA